ncbi:MAG: YfiR family protein [Chthoniobacteraceae bacterium]
MSRRLIRSWSPFATGMLLLFAPLAWAFATPDDDMDNGDPYQTEAAFICNFAKFVDWPAHKFTEPDSPLVIGIVGTDPFGGLLEEAAEDKRINERTVTVVHIESMQELRKCHILYVSRSEDDRLGSILSEVHGDNVLTVGDSERFIARGGMINFVTVGNAVRFQINDAAARHAGLKISSKLQQLAVPLSR